MPNAYRWATLQLGQGAIDIGRLFDLIKGVNVTELGIRIVRTCHM